MAHIRFVLLMCPGQSAPKPHRGAAGESCVESAASALSDRLQELDTREAQLSAREQKLQTEAKRSAGLPIDPEAKRAVSWCVWMLFLPGTLGGGA